MTARVSIDRTSLSLSALVIADASTPLATYVLTGSGLGRPAVTWRETYAPDNPYISGRTLLGAVKEQSSLPLEVLVQASTSAALDTAVQELADAVWQFSYDVTVTIDGLAKVWTCTPAAVAPSSGNEVAVKWLQHIDVLQLTIPVYPIPGA
jgi:hypothetical protein